VPSNERFRRLCRSKSAEKGYKIGVITGGDDPMVRHRIHYLGITDYYAKVHHKLEKFEEFKQNTISKRRNSNDGR
jgi:3-deoxy-D-manno-octulosonate 8-phosphate phosphatase KdsC-like HAD superfamily phosphatase